HEGTKTPRRTPSLVSLCLLGRIPLCSLKIRAKYFAAGARDGGLERLFADLFVQEAHGAVEHGDVEAVGRLLAELRERLAGVEFQFLGLRPGHSFAGFHDHDRVRGAIGNILEAYSFAQIEAAAIAVKDAIIGLRIAWFVDTGNRVVVGRLGNEIL